MAKGGQTTTQKTGFDPQSQDFINLLRQQGQSGADTALNTPGSFFEGPDSRSIEDQIAPFLNPFISQVIGGVGNEFDNLRGQARNSVSDRAIQSGAIGGSRAGVAEGVRLGELDRAQTSQVGGLLSQGFREALQTGLQQSEQNRGLRERQNQEPLFRQLQALGFLQGGLGPTGSTGSTTTPGGSLGGTLGGLGLAGLGLAFPPAAAAGAAFNTFGGGGAPSGGAQAPQFTDPLFGPGGFGQFRR